MEITRDALVRVVKAARISMRMAEDMQKLFQKPTWTCADECAGFLKDALYMILGETDGLENSRTMLLLQSDMSDEAVADAILLTDRVNQHIKAPAPNTITPEEMHRFYQQNGGYCYTPEGEFR